MFPSCLIPPMSSHYVYNKTNIVWILNDSGSISFSDFICLHFPSSFALLKNPNVFLSQCLSYAVSPLKAPVLKEALSDYPE